MADYTKYYRAYMYMQDILQNDFTYNYINEGLKDADKGEDYLKGKTNEKVIDMDWVEAIEETLPYIQNAIDEQRRFIKQVENVVRVELAKKTGPESVKHLSMHTNFIAKVEGDMVTPNKILTIEREETFATYENRVLMTLIRKALNFVDDKYSKMKDVPDDIYNDVKVNRLMEIDGEKVDFKFNYEREAHDVISDDLDVQDVEQLSDFDRIRRCRITLNEFNNTQLIQEISKEPEVRPPITQTNLLKKNPNFKKVVELWNFLDTYKKRGFEIVGEEFNGDVDDKFKQDVYFTMGFEHFMMNIATNPGLRKMLQEKYEEENARIAEEEAKPEKIREDLLKAQIEAVRKEEMAIRLKEIRERDKKILDLQNEVRNLKNQLDEKERMILALKGKISALEDEVKALKEELKQTKLELLAAQARIKELEEENEQLKAKIAELEAHIEKLNATIEELNKQIDILKDRVRVLLQENAEQKAKIEEQKAIIAEQTAKIQDLELQVAEQLAKITALTDNIAQCEAKIAEDERKINNLTERNEKLTTTLQKERQETKEREAKMAADHAAEVKKLENNLSAADEAHAKEIADLNADFAEKTNLAEQKRIKDLADKQEAFEKQLQNVKSSNEAVAAAVSAKHQSEIKKVQKSVDKRVEAAEKAAEKRMKEKIKEVQKNAQSEIRKAERRANEKSSAALEEAKAVRGSADLISRDFAFGGARVISEYADVLAKSGRSDIGARLKVVSSGLKSVTAASGKKGVSLSRYSSAGLKVAKLYKRATAPEEALGDIDSLLVGLKSEIPVCVSFSGTDKSVAELFAERAKLAGAENIIIENNRSLKSGGLVAIHFCAD